MDTGIVYYVINTENKETTEIGGHTDFIKYLSSHVRVDQLIECGKYHDAEKAAKAYADAQKSYSFGGFRYHGSRAISMKEISFNGNDIVHTYSYVPKCHGTYSYLTFYEKVLVEKKRKYAFVDSNGCYVDIRNFTDAVINQSIEDTADAERRRRCTKYGTYYTQSQPKTKFVYGETYALYPKTRPYETFRFRAGAVPGVHKARGGCRWYRSPKKHRLIKLFTDTEYGRFIRKKSWIAPGIGYTCVWNDDFGIPSNERSWKQNKKCKHQWQKHAR